MNFWVWAFLTGATIADAYFHPEVNPRLSGFLMGWCFCRLVWDKQISKAWESKSHGAQ